MQGRGIWNSTHSSACRICPCCVHRDNYATWTVGDRREPSCPRLLNAPCWWVNSGNPTNPNHCICFQLHGIKTTPSALQQNVAVRDEMLSHVFILICQCMPLLDVRCNRCFINWCSLSTKAQARTAPFSELMIQLMWGRTLIATLTFPGQDKRLREE